MTGVAVAAGYAMLSSHAPGAVQQDSGAEGEQLPQIDGTVPQLLKPLTADEAAAANAALPFVQNGLERPLSFTFESTGGDPFSHRAALDCLTAAIYYESAGEPAQGQRAVAQVVLNRVRHPAFPASICGVVYQGAERMTGCQFTFTCDGSLARQPSRRGWEQARRIAERALAGEVEPAVGMSTHYHANWVAPYWAPELDKIAGLGAHLFYRWRGHWGRRQSFTQRYSGEPAAEPPNIAYVQDLLGVAGDKEAELLTLPTSVDELPMAGGGAPVAKLSTAPPPNLVADEQAAKLTVDEKEFRLADHSAGLPNP